jgi:hypothetical protein
MLEGNTAERRHAKFIPGGLTFQQTREPMLTDTFDEWLARVVCYAFSVPPLPFIQQQNRATAESAKEAALSEGLAPVMNWIKDIIDLLIERFWNAPDLEFKWGDHKEIDPASLASINSTYVRMGIKSIDEARAEIGLDPLGMERAIFTGNGRIFLEELKDPEIRKQLMGLGAPTGAPGAPGGYGAAPGAGSGFDFMAQLMGSTADQESKDTARRNTVLDLTSQDEGAVDDLDVPGLNKRLPYSGYP